MIIGVPTNNFWRKITLFHLPSFYSSRHYLGPEGYYLDPEGYYLGLEGYYLAVVLFWTKPSGSAKPPGSGPEEYFLVALFWAASGLGLVVITTD